MEESLPFPLPILRIMCVFYFLCWVQHKMYLLIDLNWLWETLLKKISTSSVRKGNVASFKKQKRNNCFVIFFDNNFVTTLMYGMLPPPLINSDLSSFSSHSADMFCNSLQTRRRKIHKGFSKRLGRCWLHAHPIREEFWKSCQKITQSPSGPPSPPRKFCKIWWKCHKAI